MLGPIHDRLGGTDLQQPPRMQYADSIAQLVGNRKIVRHHQHGDPQLLPDLAKQVQQFRLLDNVEPPGVIEHEKKFRLHQQRSSQGDLLPLDRIQFRWIENPNGLRQFTEDHHGFDPLVPLLPCLARVPELQGLAKHGVDRPLGSERVISVREDRLHPFPQPAKVATAEPGGLHLGKDDTPRLHLPQLQNRLDECLLAALLLPDDTEAFPALHRERKVIDESPLFEIVSKPRPPEGTLHDLEVLDGKVGHSLEFYRKPGPSANRKQRHRRVRKRLRSALPGGTFQEHATMKAFSPTLVLTLAACLLLPACASKSPADRRIQKNPEYYGGLTTEERNLVRQGRVKEGMSEDAVFLAWGRPDRVRSGSRQGTQTKTWLYTRHDPVPYTSVGLGGVIGSRGRVAIHPSIGYGIGSRDFAPVVERKVEFREGKVVAWERNR